MIRNFTWYIRVVLIDNPMVSQKQTSIISAWSDNEVLFNMYKSRLYRRYQNMDYDIVCGECSFDELQQRLKVDDLDKYKIILVSNFDMTRYALTQKIYIDNTKSNFAVMSINIWYFMNEMTSLWKFLTINFDIEQLSKVNIGMTDNIMYLIRHYPNICFEI